jgi:hypothetical protein
MHDTDLWLSLPTLVVEIIGFLGASALTWALWPVPTRSQVDDGATSMAAFAAVDAVVRVDQQPDHEVRATVIALRSVQYVASVVLVDHSARPSLAALATEFQAVYAAIEPADRNGLAVTLAAVRTPQFLLLDAGDIPTGDIIRRLSGDFGDPSVAIVQGLGVSLADDSAEHGPNGRHELLFERVSLNPALGRRGSAMWSGTGSLVRTDALRDVQVGTASALETQWSASADLLAAGWKITAPSGVPVVAHRPVNSEQAVSEDRVQRARAARRLVCGGTGVLRSHRFTPGQRLAVLAWSVRPLSGLRRVAFLALLVSAILAGSVPFHATAAVLVCGWLPAFTYTSLGLALLSGWTLRPGDRARWSLHSMGAACRSLRPLPTRPTRRAPIIALPSPQYGAGLVIAVVALSVVLVLRGISDRLTHTLGVMPQASLMALLIVTLWTLGLSLDLLRVLARRSQLRLAVRVVSSLPATLGERAVSIADLTSLGAGLISQTGVDVNERLLLDSAIPTRSGVTTMRVACIVRNVTRRADGDFRIGVEFGEVNDATANALAEFCVVEPVWERLGTVPVSQPVVTAQMMYVDEPDAAHSSGRMAVRLVSLFALVGAVASSAPATVDASASINHHVSGVVVTASEPAADPPADTTSVPDTIVVSTSMFTSVVESTIEASNDVETTLELNMTTTTGEFDSGEPSPVPGAMVVAVCSLDAGPDGAWGTADDTYDTPATAFTGSDGSYQLDLVGEACWATIAPPETLTDPAGGDVVLEALDVSGAAGSGPRVTLERVVANDPSVPSTGPVGTAASDDISLALRDRGGRSVGTVSGSVANGFRFERSPDQALPTPKAAQLATTTHDRSTLSLFVLALAAVLALSILLGLARPRSPRLG